MLTFTYTEIDLFCIAILLLMYFSRAKSGVKPLDQRIFDGILFCAVLAIFMDAAMFLLNGKTFPGVRILAYADNIISFILAGCLMVFWILYCDYFIYENNQKMTRRAVFYGIAFAVIVVMAVISPITGCLFYLDDQNYYHRGPGFIVYTLIMLGYLLYSASLCLSKAARCDNQMEKKEYYFLGSFVAAPLLGGIAQAFVYGTSVIWCCIVFSLLLIYINLQNRQISTDVLTGINNRRQFNRYLSIKVQTISKGKTLYAIMIDINSFKQINDTYGHREGDKALVMLSTILKRACGGKDAFLARIGGDEFVIVYECKQEGDVQALLREVDEELTQFNASKSSQYQLSVSVGYAEYGASCAKTVDGLISEADQRMYQQKGLYRQTAETRHL